MSQTSSSGEGMGDPFVGSCKPVAPFEVVSGERGGRSAPLGSAFAIFALCFANLTIGRFHFAIFVLLANLGGFDDLLLVRGRKLRQSSSSYFIPENVLKNEQMYEATTKCIKTRANVLGDEVSRG